MKLMIWRYSKPLVLAALFAASAATGLFAECQIYNWPGTPYGNIQVLTYGSCDYDLTTCAGQSCQDSIGNWGWAQYCAGIGDLQGGNLCGQY